MANERLANKGRAFLIMATNSQCDAVDVSVAVGALLERIENIELQFLRAVPCDGECN